MRYLWLIPVVLLALGASCFKKPPTIAELIKAYNESGWEKFTQGDYSSALKDFNEVLKLDSIDAKGNVGRGWTLILLQSQDLDGIVVNLNRVTDDVQWQTDAWTGLAVIRLNQQRYVEADSLAGLTLASDSSYVFEQHEEVNWRDLLVIQAQARFFLADYVSAWLAVRPLTAGTIYENLDPGNPDTWVLDGTTFALFEEALAEVINILTERYRRE